MTCLQLCVLLNFQICGTFPMVFMNIFLRSWLTLYKCVVTAFIQRSLLQKFEPLKELIRIFLFIMDQFAIHVICIQTTWLIRLELCFYSMTCPGVSLLLPGLDASPSQGYPSLKFASTHLYTWVERGTVRVKCLDQEPNGMSPARA